MLVSQALSHSSLQTLILWVVDSISTTVTMPWIAAMSSKTAQPLCHGNSSCMLQSYRLQTHLKIQSPLSTCAAVLTNELQCLSSAKPRHSLWFMDCKHLAAGASTCSLYPCSWNFLVCSHNVPAPALPYYQQAQDPHLSENGLSITEPLWYRTWIKSPERGVSDIQPLNQSPPPNTATTTTMGRKTCYCLSASRTRTGLQNPLCSYISAVLVSSYLQIFCWRKALLQDSREIIFNSFEVSLYSESELEIMDWHKNDSVLFRSSSQPKSHWWHQIKLLGLWVSM